MHYFLHFFQMKRILRVLPLALLAACGGSSSADNKDLLMKCDFDQLNGWLPDRNALTRDKAHSGAYSIKVEPGRDFSLNYLMQLGQLSTSRIRGVRFDGWVFLTDKNSTANIAFVSKESVEGKDLSTIYFGYDSVKEYGKWVAVSKEIIFPPNTNFNSALLIYLWRGGATTPAYLDDVQLTAIR
jgi:hypothetical protein